MLNKKPRPHESTPTNTNIKFNSNNKITSSSSLTTDRQFIFSPAQLKYAISNNLSCFYIKFCLDDDRVQQQKLPSAMEVVSWIRHLIQQQSAQSFGDFSLLVPAGKNRYKVGVTTKKDFLLLWNCKWPKDMNKIDIEVERPRVLPDSCAVVLRYVPTDLPKEFVTQEISRSIKSAIQFSKINYHRPRSTFDFRFCITDENEYEEVLSTGRLAIGHVLLPITALIPGLKMTYCNNCWALGHTRYQCKISPRCRKCLDLWNDNHICQKAVLCAQCQGHHGSLSMECPVVLHYRRTLKEEVNNAVKYGWLNPVKVENKGAWVKEQAAPSNLQNFQGTDQLGELVTQVKMVLEGTPNTMQQMINASLEKKNKQLLLQKIVQQLEDFKDDFIGKLNSLSIDTDHQQQQSKSTSATPPPIPLNRPTDQTKTLPTNKGKNVLVEDEQLMEITNG
ncbi:unnamed protein product [Rotaria sp. Silwood2]|nr:unnamed protein product [Rotaria sp. Silwood2]CAF2928134.1 unnamed protein product [Rotaria sp. Silwood2]CAF3305928.1 unnamed protein product [Rotaria sp. Silwood2]CAF4375821.1 unnamed protein product [Rotaria sp. Silwood2]CAF4445662.1 unnamed protein product [Rotaria sp. Silwood2]